MSKNIKNILKKQKSQRKRAGAVVAEDSMITGEEPVWDNWDSWDLDKFFKEQSRALKFYNYYMNSKKLKNDVLLWMKNNGYSKNDIKIAKNAPDQAIGMAVSSVCRCLNRGMPAYHPQSQKYWDSKEGLSGTPGSFDDFVKENLAKVINTYRGEVEEKQEERKKGPTVRDRMESKCRETILGDLEIMLDSWIQGNIKPLDIYKKMQEYDIPANCVNYPKEWLETQYAESKSALDKTDDQAVEGYSYLTKPQLKKWVSTLESMIADLDKFKNAKKAKRKPRAKKEKPVEKLIERVKYCKEDHDLKIVSYSPAKLIGASKVILFNRKYRSVSILNSDNNGFSIKGTSLQNVDLEKSEVRKIRKPEDFLPIVQNKTERQINNEWKKLTTKINNPNSTRLNEHTLIVRIF